MGYPRYVFFVDVEGTKDVKQMITLLAITSQFIPNLFIALCNEETIIDKEAGNGQFIKSDI